MLDVFILELHALVMQYDKENEEEDEVDLLSVFYYIMVNTSQFNLMHIQCLLSYKTKRTVLHYGPRLHCYY